MQGPDVHRRRGWLWTRLAAKYIGGAFQKLAAPLRDLIGMHIKLLGQFCQGLFSLDCSQRYFRL